MKHPRIDWPAALGAAAVLWAAALPAVAGAAAATQDVPVLGEKLPAEAYGPAWVETMEEVLAREAQRPPTRAIARRARNGAHGVWEVPGQRSLFYPRSGEKNAINKWGDTEMGIGFGGPVDLEGVWVAGQASAAVWTSGLRVVGFREGREVGRTDWFEDVDESPSWFDIGLAGVDRVEFHARAVQGGAGWYSIDDLSFRPVGGERVVVDFEDVHHGFRLSGSGYRGLRWEEGRGSYLEQDAIEVHAPLSPAPDAGALGGGGDTHSVGGSATAPSLGVNFRGPRMFDEPGTDVFPPDTCGVAGPSHFLAIVNSNLSIYSKATGNQVLTTGLSTFFASNFVGDPRASYDPLSQRWIVMATNFSSGERLYVAASQTSDPTGAWFKTSFTTDQGSDAGKWPDYPTQGVGTNGVYFAAWMVGGSTMTIWALDKNDLYNGVLDVTAFRSLPNDGAIQPCIHWETTPQDYLVSRSSSTALRLRKMSWSGGVPSIASTTTINIPGGTGSQPPDAPALGSSTPLDSVDLRLMNAVYRAGSVWAANCVASGGRAAARWYEIDPVANSHLQSGTVTDGARWFLFPTIAVTAGGDAVLGFSGSNASEFAGCWFSGRLAGDPPGEMSPPQQYKAGEGAYNRIDGAGRNRWGDYSLTSADPAEPTKVWTIQEFAWTSNRWSNWIAELEFTSSCPPPQNYCVTSPNSVGAGSLLFSGGTTSIAANDLSFIATGCPTNKAGVFFFGPNPTASFFGDGLLCVAGGISRFPVQMTDIFGTAILNLDYNQFPASLLAPGLTRYFQFWYRDPAFGGTGFNLSDGMEATFCD